MPYMGLSLGVLGTRKGREISSKREQERAKILGQIRAVEALGEGMTQES